MKPENGNVRKEIIQKIKSSRAQSLETDLGKDLLQGNKVALSKAITLVESTRSDDQAAMAALMREVLPQAGNSLRIGITGVPGAGKSSFIEAFGMQLIEQGKKIAVLAIDPSSEAGKGSILGDKTRMSELAVHPNAFIRPSPNSGVHGGVARKTREAILLCEAAGYDIILVETVGVGQSETAVRSMVDMFLLLAIAGAGDELQGIKRGIMELADIVIVNKADGDNLNRAKSARMDIQRALHFFPPMESGWTPQAGVCSSIERRGLAEVQTLIMQYFEVIRLNGYFQKQREDQLSWWLEDSIRERLIADFFSATEVQKDLIELRNQLRKAEISVSEAVNKLLSKHAGIH